MEALEWTVTGFCFCDISATTLNKCGEFGQPLKTDNITIKVEEFLNLFSIIFLIDSAKDESTKKPPDFY